MPSPIRILSAALVAAVGLAAAGGAQAHHSFAMFDPKKVVVLNGAVKDVVWTNPHVSIHILARQQPGEAPKLWTVELTSPGNLKRDGWTSTSVKPGDLAEIQIHPLRNGQAGGGFIEMKLLATGQVLHGAVAAPGSSAAQ